MKPHAVRTNQRLPPDFWEPEHRKSKNYEICLNRLSYQIISLQLLDEVSVRQLWPKTDFQTAPEAAVKTKTLTHPLTSQAFKKLPGSSFLFHLKPYRPESTSAPCLEKKKKNSLIKTQRTCSRKSSTFPL